MFYNIVQAVGIPHPIHIHQETFEIIERGTFEYTPDGDYTKGILKHAGTIPLTPGDSGRKDTSFVYPGTYMKVRIRFQKEGQFMWHCHLLEHEDNEMMRPFRVGPVQLGQPADLPMKHDMHGMPGM